MKHVLAYNLQIDTG